MAATDTTRVVGPPGSGMLHLTPADYKAMPWANGKGTTTELHRENRPDGQISIRLSVASVVENGPFSVFAGLTRSLTVIEGPGFDLIGRQTLRADLLKPVEFSGDDVIAAANVTAPSRDFNVMVWHALAMRVSIIQDSVLPVAPCERAFCYALGAASVGDVDLAAHDLLCNHGPLALRGGPVILVQIQNQV